MFALFALFTKSAFLAIGAPLSSFPILLILLIGVVFTWTGLTALTLSWRVTGRKETCRVWIR